MQRLGDCEHCPLNDRPIVPGFGPKGGLAIVGEAPGQNEVRRSRPFVGEAGTLLRSVLTGVGIDPDDVYYTNAVVRHPIANKTPTLTAIRACNQRLIDELADVRPTKILTAGGVALTALSRGASRVLPITRMRGRGQWVNINGHDTYMLPTIHPALVLRDPNMYQDLAFDIQKWINNDAPLPEPEVDVSVAMSRVDLLQYLTDIQHASLISCDLETYGFHPIRDPLISIGFGVADATSDGGVAIIVPEQTIDRKGVRDLVWDFLTEIPATFAFHNAKFDLQFLHTYFSRAVPWDVKVADTMLMHYLLDERPIGRYLGHGLKDISRTWYDIEDYSWDFDAFYALPPDERDYEGLYTYQGKDCVYTARLYFDIKARLEQEMHEEPSEWFNPLHVHDTILVPGARALSEAEHHGTYIDVPFFTVMGATLQARVDTAVSDLHSRVDATFNPGSPVQVARLVDSMGAPGRHPGSSVEREALEALIRLWGKKDERSKTLQLIIDYRNDMKTLGTYVTGLLEKVDPDGRIRPDFQLAGTATGRLSCRNPNFQNIPAYMEWHVREGFAAPPMHVFVEADYSQLELRVAAWLSQDPDLIDIFASGKDIHSEVATALFHKPAEEITEKERYMAKRVDFGLVYGRGGTALATGPEMDYYVDELGGARWTIEEAEVYIRRFLDRFPRLRDWLEETRRDTVRDQRVDTPLGRRRRFPYVSRGNVWHTRNQAVNTPIQSVASDLCLQALIRVAQRQEEFGGHILFTVHDSVDLEVPAHMVDVAVPILREEFEENLEIDTTGIPFKCDIEVGPNWGTLKKVPR